MAVATQDSVNHSYVRRAAVDEMPAPAATTGAIGWIRGNLLSSPTNVALTVFSALLILWIVPPVIEFMFVHAVWSGSDREACLRTPVAKNLQARDVVTEHDPHFRARLAEAGQASEESAPGAGLDHRVAEALLRQGLPPSTGAQLLRAGPPAASAC